MNLNNNPEELKKEEQRVLNELIDKLDDEIKVQPIWDKETFQKARDELYRYRVLVSYKNDECDGIEEIKIGLHSCQNMTDYYIESWKMPLCRNLVLNNKITHFKNTVTDKNGIIHNTDYDLIAKNDVEIKFDKVKKARNLFPSDVDISLIDIMEKYCYFGKEYCDFIRSGKANINGEPSDVIADEFLRELLKRRKNPEFVNIVFSVQEQQGRIIQSSYSRNMIVQGCAGSGKSMIMLHRLPIILYDNDDSLARSNLYIITPSKTYIQMAENMLEQLEIPDIKKGTIEEYYDYCIGKYLGHKPGEYGKINQRTSISVENENYIYSTECVNDILSCFKDIFANDDTILILSTKLNVDNARYFGESDSYAKAVNNRLVAIENVINKNNKGLTTYFKAVNLVISKLRKLEKSVAESKTSVVGRINARLSKEYMNVEVLQEGMKNLDPYKDRVAVINRRSDIENSQKIIDCLKKELDDALADDEYFDGLQRMPDIIHTSLEIFEGLEDKYEKNECAVIYDMMSNIGTLIGSCYMIFWEISRFENRYGLYEDEFNDKCDEVKKCVEELQDINEKCLTRIEMQSITDVKGALLDMSSSAVSSTYACIMKKVGVEANEKGKIKAFTFSPYLYLQVLYQYHGIPKASRESIISIDEAQGISPEELRLIKHVNGDKSVFNIFGDVYQHIEGTKGVDDWKEFNDIIDYDMYEMHVNYRNAAPIAEYCNKQFGMNMQAINDIDVKDVKEFLSNDEFVKTFKGCLSDKSREGVGAVLIGNRLEAKYLLKEFAEYTQCINDMSDGDVSIHRDKWNIINIDDAKGLEFTTVIVLSARMSKHEKYIAYTRALDELYVYPEAVDVAEFIKSESHNQEMQDEEEAGAFTIKETDNGKEQQLSPEGREVGMKHIREKDANDYSQSNVKRFFEERKLNVVDERGSGGMLWVIGRRHDIRNVVDEAVNTYDISGKYSVNLKYGAKEGWCTRTRK